MFCVFFVNLFTQQFPSQLKGVTFSAVTHLCSKWGSSEQSRLNLAAPGSLGSQRGMSVGCKSNVEHCYCWFWVYYTDIALSSVSSHHKHLVFFMFLGFVQKVIPYLKIVFSSSS